MLMQSQACLQKIIVVGDFLGCCFSCFIYCYYYSGVLFFLEETIEYYPIEGTYLFFFFVQCNCISFHFSQKEIETRGITYFLYLSPENYSPLICVLLGQLMWRVSRQVACTVNQVLSCRLRKKTWKLHKIQGSVWLDSTPCTPALVGYDVITLQLHLESLFF